MSDKAEIVIFWIFAIPLIASALGVVIAKSPVHAAMSLVAAFFFLAGMYVLLTAHLLAWLQVLVYAGAIMVVFLFVVMLLNFDDEMLGVNRMKVMKLLGVAGAAALGALVVVAVREAGPMPMARVAEDFGTVRAVGRVLFTQYLLPFEATSLLLLVSIVGAVVVAKQRI
ncbi:MAG TPA: NADH-quinone oxidoreductase subunit J [Anaeromyxobacteraceae bacterium]|nr:NADH-quinone oxidoreductase subunit J [Anaeromyxobacteraceae bacterium]